MESNPFFEDDIIEDPIIFHSEDIDFELTNAKATQSWITQIISREDKELIQLNYIFCSDEYLHKINVQYLDHDTYTDIITFPLAAAPLIESDIFISIDRIKENAIKFEVPFERELKRVLIHGVLHLCGYGDKTDAEAKLMREKEDEAIELYNEERESRF